MPGNILNADTGFPQFTGDESSDAKIDKVMNYLYMLLEQLRYSLNNLDADNFNDTGLREIGEGIARPLQTSFENEFSKTNAMIEGISNEFGSQITLLTDWVGTDADGNLISSAANITQSVNANAASITSLAQFRKTVEDGTISSISSINQKADENAASIVQLNQWKGTTSSSLAAVQSLASQNDAKISLLTSWKDTAEDEIDGLAASVASIEQTADENGASISQIVKAVGKDGEVNAASIVAAVNDAGSSVKIDADKLLLDSDVYITGNDGSNVAMKLYGNRIALNHPSGAAASASSISFWYDGIDNELLANMRTTRDTSLPSEERYKLVIETLSRGSYPVVLRLISGSGLSMSAKKSIYMYAETYCTVEAVYNTRIRANLAFSDAQRLTGGVSDYDYSFNTDGIYYGSKQIISTSGGVTAVFG